MLNKTFYFNSYDTVNLSHKQWQDDINKHHKAYNELKSFKQENENSPLSEELFNHLVNNNYNMWITIKNDNPYFNPNCYLIELTLTYINYPITFYIEKQLLNNNIVSDIVEAQEEPEQAETMQETNQNELTEHEKEIIAARLQIKPKQLNNSIFTPQELKDADFLGFIMNHANILTTKQTGNTKQASQWTREESQEFNFFISNIKVNILDGTHKETVLSIRKEYKELKERINHRIKIEKSFSLNDYEVPLNIFIERACKAENVLRKEHEQIVKEALENSLNVPSEVLKDYPELTQTNEHNETSTKETNELNNTYTVARRSFPSYQSAYNYCISNDFDPNTMIQTNEPQTEPTNNNNVYWYEYRLRGFSLGCQPPNHIEVNHNIGRFGAIAYNRPLTDKEIYQYELKPYKTKAV